MKLALAAFLALALCGVSLAVHSSQPLNHDSAWYLTSASAWLGGASIYRETGFDPNPPTVIWLSALVVGFARACGLALDTTLRLFALSCYLGAALLAGYALRLRKLGSELTLSVLAAFLAFGLSMPQPDFGQREHFLIALLFPYLCTARLADDSAEMPRWLRVTAGVLLGLGLALKPHYLLLPLALFTWRVVRRKRWLIIEEVCAAACVVAYVLLVLWKAPAYLKSALPLAGVVYYQAYAGSLADTLVASRAAGVGMLLAWSVTIAGNWRKPYLTEQWLGVSLCLATTAAWLAFVVQRTGWHYQSGPARVLSGVALAYSVALFAATRLPKRLPVVALLTVSGTAAFGLLRLSRDYRARLADWEPTRAVLRGLPTSAGPITIAALSTSLQPAFPAVLYLNGTWGMRYPCLWMLPWVVEQSTRDTSGVWHIPGAAAVIDRDMRAGLLEDFRKHRPDVVLVQDAHTKQGLTKPVDLLEYLGQSPEFSQEWSSFRECGRATELRLYCRKR